MYTVKVELYNDTELLKTLGFSFTDEESANWLLAEIEANADAGIPAGSVISPLPPHKVHSAKGLVSPKPPIQVKREMRGRLSELPQEYRDEDDF